MNVETSGEIPLQFRLYNTVFAPLNKLIKYLTSTMFLLAKSKTAQIEPAEVFFMYVSAPSTLVKLRTLL